MESRAGKREEGEEGKRMGLWLELGGAGLGICIVIVSALLLYSGRGLCGITKKPGVDPKVGCDCFAYSTLLINETLDTHWPPLTANECKNNTNWTNEYVKEHMGEVTMENVYLLMTWILMVCLGLAVIGTACLAVLGLSAKPPSFTPCRRILFLTCAMGQASAGSMAALFGFLLAYVGVDVSWDTLPEERHLGITVESFAWGSGLLLVGACLGALDYLLLTFFLQPTPVTPSIPPKMETRPILKELMRRKLEPSVEQMSVVIPPPSMCGPVQLSLTDQTQGKDETLDADTLVLNQTRDEETLIGTEAVPTPTPVTAPVTTRTISEDLSLASEKKRGRVGGGKTRGDKEDKAMLSGKDSKRVEDHSLTAPSVSSSNSTSAPFPPILPTNPS